jgi:L-ascorbate metabolism protein UlaG (beta-lactamase superfamily)
MGWTNNGKGWLKMYTFENDIFSTAEGDLTISFLGHASLWISFNGKNIYVDPFSKVTDYSILPCADLILITHEHPDHLDLNALSYIRDDKTIIIISESCAKMIHGGIVLRNGEKHTEMGILIDVVPAYNLIHMRNKGEPFHPKGIGNGYILTFGGKKIYIGGDTENIPEMQDIKNIAIAFLPMNLPYTMTPEMVANAATVLQPQILYPYHFGKTQVSELVDLLKHEKDIEVRIRKME